MFEFLEGFTRDVVGFGCDAGKAALTGVAQVSSELLAGPAEELFGRNDFSDAVRGAGELATGAAGAVVDGFIKPVATAVATAPIRKAECAYDVVGGLAEAAFTGRTAEGLERAGTAAGKLTVMVATAGLLHAAGGALTDALGAAAPGAPAPGAMA